MPKRTVAAAATGLPEYDRNHVIHDADRLRHLLSTVDDLVMEMDYGHGRGRAAPWLTIHPAAQLSRNLALGLAATTSLAATAITARDADVSPELLRLFEAHRAEDDAHGEAADAQFEATRPASGVPAEELDRICRDRRRAWDVEGAARTAICAYRCSTLEEANLKVHYIFSNLVCIGAMEDDDLEALLQSSRAEA